ncbi:MAG TPA: isocitrate/isopropylmalate family dehydrogenase, partial [Eubacteriales bacterium]|nr:isocitrate/isopropylmalate family dehydrogenase [Eubacteriales bacterium]
MKYKIAVIEGDGIGPEIMAAALGVLGKVAEIFGHRFEYAPVLAGGASIDRFGVPLAEEALKTCLECDSVMLAAVGGPKWDTLPGHLRPERALLGIRKELGLFANLRPAKLMRELAAASPLRADIAARGVDLMIVREL